jgi:hypothetical protein
MDKLEKLSEVQLGVIATIYNDPTMCQLLTNLDGSPLDHDPPTVPRRDLFMGKIFPFPPSMSVGDEDTVELRIYYPKIKIRNTSDFSRLCFDIVVSGSPEIWLINVDGENKIRPLYMMQQIAKLLHDKDIGVGAKLMFDEADLYNVNDKFYTYTFYADMLNVTSGKR